jgi:hypothetical protein
MAVCAGVGGVISVWNGIHSGNFWDLLGGFVAIAAATILYRSLTHDSLTH